MHYEKIIEFVILICNSLILIFVFNFKGEKYNVDKSYKFYKLLLHSTYIMVTKYILFSVYG